MDDRISAEETSSRPCRVFLRDDYDLRHKLRHHHELQTFTPFQIFLFAIAFTVFGAACMYVAMNP